MPTFLDARTRHTNCYLHLAESAADSFAHESMQAEGIAIFDHNRVQIETALEWIQKLEETYVRDIAFVAFVDAFSAMGMLRYSIRDRLIPLMEQKIAVAQRLGMKDMEADAYDDLGIKYAYLGYLRQAIDLFQTARMIALQTSDQELLKDIENHIQQARSQLGGQIHLPVRLTGILKLLPLVLRLQIARFQKNPFVEVNVLNDIADIYLQRGKFDKAAKLFSRAIVLSKSNSYRLGQLDASMGLLQVEVMKQGEVAELSTALRVPELGDDFEWSNDLLFLQTMLELQPAIDTAERMAQSLAAKNLLRAKEIYELLDRIFAEMDLAQYAVQEKSDRKQEILLTSLTAIRDSLAHIIRLYSNQNAEEHAN